MLMGREPTLAVVNAALWTVAALYGVLALAIGSVQGRRLGAAGITAATLGSILAWLILELFYHLFEIGSPQMRAPLVAGIALAVVGAVIGLQRAADLEATDVEFGEEAAAEEPAEPAGPADDELEPTEEP